MIRSLEDQVGYLRQEVEDWKDEARRKDAIIMSLTQRIPELEAPAGPGSEPRDAPGAPAEGSEGANPRPASEEAQEGEQRSWWRRWFGSG